MSNEHDLGLNDEESQRLKELRDALTSEFRENREATKTRTPIGDIEDLKDDFLTTLKHVVNHADSQALRAKVAMWGYDKLLDQGKVNNDPIRELIEGLEQAKVTVGTDDPSL